MISKITAGFEKASEENRAAYIPFIMAGFPDEETFIGLLKSLDNCGADVIEVGIPFSDPLADGPIIQKAGKIALENGSSLEKTLSALNSIQYEIQSPVVLMSYWNPILKMGIDRFGEEMKKSGLSGTIIPDLPPDEATCWMNVAASHGLDTIFMVAPTTTPKRLETIVNASKGFVYLVSMTGVTGSELVVSNALLKTVLGVKKLTSLPVAVGFGVSNPDQAAALSDVADGVIVGSALIKKCLEAPDGMAAIKAVSDLSLGIVERLGKRQVAGNA
jgi:tryptophan synthase alpha chain